MIKACDKTLKMQSWKTVFRVLSLILYFSHGANQTINDVQFHSLKTVEASDKDEGKTNKDIVVRELAKETAQWVLDKNKHNLIIETTPSKSQNNAGIYIEETDKAKGYFKLSSKKEATNKNKEVVKKISKEGTEIKNQTTNETQSEQTLTVNKQDKHKIHLLNKYKDVVKQTRRKDEIFVKVLGQERKTKRKQSVNNSRNYNREINTNQSIPQLSYNKIDDEIAPLQIINEFRKENGNVGVFDQPYDSKEVVGKAPNKKNINRNQITQNHLKIPVKHRQDYGSIVNLGKHNDQPNDGSLEMITKLNNFVKEYGNDAGDPNKNKLKESKVENKIRNSNITLDYEDTKFKALKKDLIASIMNKTSMLVIKLINDRYPSDQEKARVLHIIKEKVLSKVSPLSERYLLWTEVISKGVDATFEKIRHLSRKAYRRQYNHEMKVSISEPVVRPQLNIPFKQLSSSHPIKCEVLTQKACTKIITLNTLVCESGNGSVTMEKLCDGIYDCEDGSDEVKCSDKATNKLKQAERIVEEAESSKFLDCFKYDESYLGRKKSDSLMKVIARQISLIAHCIDSPLVKASINGETRDRRILEQASNQIATVISSVSLSLDGAICTELVHSADDYDSIMQRVDEHEEDIVKVIDEDDIGEEWMFRSCKCFGKACLVYPCDEHCKKICDHKHSLGRIMCRSFSRDTTISLDLICDGKIDCEDESDEKDCNEGNAYARFEGFNAFGRVGQLIQNKIHSKYYSPVRGKLFKLQNSVTQLQKLNANLEVDKSAIKSARNKAFELLGSIYVDMLTKVSTFNETEQIFVFLMSLHNELIGALKHSHTGNKRIVPTEDCSCRGTTCNIPFCPLYCVKACSVEPSFTQLACKKQPTVKVDLNHICDGTRDCPLGDDEKLCDKDMCRKHNFLLLHTRLNKEFRTDLGQNLLGEILKTWKQKAIQTVKTAEVAVIANRENYKLIVKKILHDLVMAYSFTDDIKGNPRQLYNTFYNVSQQVIKLVPGQCSTSTLSCKQAYTHAHLRACRNLDVTKTILATECQVFDVVTISMNWGCLLGRPYYGWGGPSVGGPGMPPPPGHPGAPPMYPYPAPYPVAFYPVHPAYFYPQQPDIGPTVVDKPPEDKEIVPELPGELVKLPYSTYRWVPGCTSQNSIPSGALRVGTDVDGHEIYAGRSPHEGDILPAKVIPAKNACYVSFCGEEILKDQFEVLVPSMFAWQFATNGEVPPGAIKAGVTANGEPLYYGRVTHDGCTTPGKIQPSHETCYYPFAGEERDSREYEVLVLL